MLNKPAIIITAYNRPDSLNRLLFSLQNAIYNVSDIDLIISIDNSGRGDTKQIAENFEWKCGAKKIIAHENHLGLKSHILFCGDLVSEFDSVILLEDDLLVSPFFYSYAQQSLEFYRGDKTISGISLYNYEVSESSFYPFKALDDGSDVYFMQVASSWGQVWTKTQWEDFRKWFKVNQELKQENHIPSYLHQWGKNSWKKHFIHYMIGCNKYFVFPRLSLTTNFEERGTNSSTSNAFHVPLQVCENGYKFCVFSTSKSVYDAWFEIIPASLNQFNNSLKKFDYSVDCYGAKEIENISSEYILTSKISKDPLFSFSAELFPLESNVSLALPGKQLGLYKVKDNLFVPGKLQLRNILAELHEKRRAEILVVIPIEVFDAGKLKISLDSFCDQEYDQKQCKIVTNPLHLHSVYEFIKAYKFKFEVVASEKESSLFSLVQLGFSKTNNGIISWMNQGSELNSGALKKVADVFGSFQNVSWICGITNELPETNVRATITDIRITKNIAYNNLKEKHFNESLELHFFREHCLSQLPAELLSFHELYFQLLSNYQVNPVIYKLGKAHRQAIFINKNDKALLLNKYKYFNTETKLRDKFLTVLFKCFPQNSTLKNLYYRSFHNLPDVLRYDDKHDSFYFSKN